MTDLTKGSALKQIFFFAIPYLIGNLFQQFYNIADMVIVGQTIDAQAYAAVGATGSLVWLTTGAVQALTLGFSVLVAQAAGANNQEQIKKAFGASIWLSGIFSVGLSAITVIFARPMLELLRTPDDIIDQAYRYLLWVFAGLIATALFNLLSNVIRALGDSKTPLYFLMFGCTINIVLDYIFIALCGMNTEGAGFATVLAQLITGLLCILYICKKQPLLHITKKHLKWDRKMNRNLLRVAIPMSFLNMVLAVGSIVMQFVTNGFGTLYVTAQATGAKLEQFVTMPIMSFGSAVSVFAAQNYGANQLQRVIKSGRKALLLCYVWSILASIVILPLGPFVIRLFIGSEVDPSVVENGYLYILVNTVLIFILSPLVIYKNVLQAIGQTFWTMVSGFSEILARAGTALLILFLMDGLHLFDEGMGFFLMCFANPMAWLFGLATVFFDYRSLMRKLKKRMEQEPPSSKE